MQLESSVYVRILLWAYSKQHSGFSKQEMRDFLGTPSNEEWAWIEWLFSSGLNGEAPLIWSMPGESYGSKFYLTSSGVSAAVDYLELKEAQEAGRRGEFLAKWAIAIGVLVGLAQIVVQVCFR